jgi:rare lipoprotein A
MTGVLSSRAKRWLGARFTRKRHGANALVYGSLLAALIVCASTGNSRANSKPFASNSQADHAPAAHLTSLLATKKHSTAVQRFSSLFRYPSSSAILNMRADVRSFQDITGSIPAFRLGRLPPQPLFAVKPFLLASLTPPATVDAHSEAGDGTATTRIVGIASMYDPIHPDENKDCGGPETASGELYDEEGWTAAIRIDLRDRFGGVGYGKNYQPAYALVEAGDKRVIIRVNDVGPLMPGRIIDLNQRAMRYFDPTLQLGLLKDVRVTPLPGPYWTAGPIGGDGETVRLAAVAAQ